MSRMFQSQVNKMYLEFSQIMKVSGEFKCYYITRFLH